MISDAAVLAVLADLAVISDRAAAIEARAFDRVLRTSCCFLPNWPGGDPETRCPAFFTGEAPCPSMA